MDLPNSTLEIKIQQFVTQYGPEQLIEWIDEFDLVGGSGKFAKFKKLEKIACDVCGVTISDMRKLSRNECINARRIIAALSANRIMIKPAEIGKFMGNMSPRNINYYIKDAEDWIANPKLNRAFYEYYNRVCEKINF